MELSDLTYYAYLLKNDMHHIHLHCGGPDFDKIHSLTQELYEELDKEIDDLAEMAISEGCSVESFSNVKSFVDESQWEPENENLYDWTAFVNALNDKGGKYLDALSETTPKVNVHRSILDEFEAFWQKEINFKNTSRLLSTENAPNYVDAEVELADDEFIPDDDDAEGIERLQTDLMITGGIEIDPLAATMFTSPYEDSDDEDSDDEEEKDDDKKSDKEEE